MTPGVLGKIFLWWLALLALATLNGVLREQLLIPYFGSRAGLVLSGLVLCALVLTVAVVAIPALHYKGVSPWAVGTVWLLLTLSFELTFGLIVQHRSFAEVMSAYTFNGGNLWSVVAAAILVGPRLAVTIRRLH